MDAKIIGIIGLILVQGSTLFQIIRFVRCKRTEGVSIVFWWMIFVGLLFYEDYAIYIRDPVYIASNLTGSILSAISITLYYIYRRRQ